MRAVHSSVLLLLVLAGTACENGPPWGGGGTPPDDAVAPDFGPTAAYDRRLVFLGPGAELPTAAIFDFVTLSDSAGIRRGIRARVIDDARWRPLMDVGWEMEPMRDPWRLVPHGSLTLIVGETGDLGTLVYRDSVPARLHLGATLAEHSPDVGTQLVLRSARLTLGDRTVPGVLLDAQLGRTVNPELAAGQSAATGTTSAGPGAGTADPGAAVGDTAGGNTVSDPAAVDTGATATISPTPIARPGSEALLLNDEGYYTVLATASGGALAWIRNAGRSDIRRGARLEPTAWSSGEESAVQVPTAWQIVSAEGELQGELTARSTDRVALDDGSGLEALTYVLVSGWIEDRMVRRDVFGLVRHVR